MGRLLNFAVRSFVMSRTIRKTLMSLYLANVDDNHGWHAGGRACVINDKTKLFGQDNYRYVKKVEG